MNPAQIDPFEYDDRIVKQFVLAMLVWAGVAMLLGIWIALELASHKFNLGLPWFTFGRLRPLHTNAAIFAFAGNAIFAGMYHSTQRLLRTRFFSDGLARFHFWGWQAIILSAALTLPFGFTQGKEYAELEWPIDLAIAVVWVSFGVNFFFTLRRRREKHIYVAIWFYIATLVTVALLHVVNSISFPVGALKSYSVYAGIQDALVQWWYGHNAVAFFLTTPFLGLMYYYIPKAIGRPVYSYRLSVIHFWTLVFLYIWAGPHHLLYTALPEWAQNLGMVFSIMLWIPSWGGMINALLTLRGAWDRVRSEAVLKFLATATIFYGMATFEGPLLSIKSVSAVGHYTDWIIGHVHGGALGWNGFLAFGMAYYLVPRLWRTKLHSEALAHRHFNWATLGILLYIFSMWASGITQGLMWLAMDAQGQLRYPDFVETVTRIQPLYWVRAAGGLLYFGGYLIMIYNLCRTIRSAPRAAPAESVAAARLPRASLSDAVREATAEGARPHRVLEGLPGIFMVLSFFAVLTGSVVELVPMLAASGLESTKIQATPYTPLQLMGRDLYIREGCYTCHSQMIRTLVPEVVRYGKPSEPAESMYDHPFQWGSRRIGPELARVGRKYPDVWHYRHLNEPRDLVAQSLMPAYPWLLRYKADFAGIRRRVSAMRSLGVPYTAEQVELAESSARDEARQIAAELIAQGAPADVADREIVALIAYLQGLGHNLPEEKP